jgi:potassium efflux system protein
VHDCDNTLLSGIGLGQGLANIAQNFVSGIQILSQDMFHIGDWVDCGNISGEIVKIGLTHTVLKAMEGTRIVVQNSAFTTAGDGMLNYNIEPVKLFQCDDRLTLELKKMMVEVPLIIRHNEDVELVRQMFLAVCAKDER